MNCNNCGSSLNKDDKFCKVCGTFVTPDLSKCSECGSRINEDDKFCGSCGHRINQDVLSQEDSYKDEEVKSEVLDFDELDENEIGNFDYRIAYDDLYKESPEIIEKGVFASVLGSFRGKKPKKSNKAKEVKKEKVKNNKSTREEEKIIREDFTSELPDLSKIEDPIEARKKLSDKKKKLLEESIEKAGNNENFVIGDPSESDLMQTQKIDLSEIQKIETEIRKVRVKEENNKKQEEKLEEKSHTEIKKQKAKKKEKQKQKVSKVKEDKKAKEESFKIGNYIIPILLCLALVFASGAFLTAKTNKNAVVKNLENAVANEDYTKTSSIILRSDKSPIEENDIKSFIRLMNENDVYKSSLMGAIKEDAIKLTRDSSYQSNRVYRLEKVGRKYLFFSDYRVVLDPVKTSLVNGDDLTYTFANNEFTSSSDELVLLPGIYKLSQGENTFDVNVSNTNPNFDTGLLMIDISDLDFSVEEKEDTEEVTEVDESETEKFDLAGDVSLFLESPDKAIVYINGEDTGLSVEEFNLLDGVNIKQGDKIQVKEKLPWGDSFSDEHIYDGESSIYLEANLNSKDNMQVVMDKVIQLLKEDEEARQTMSMDPFTSLMEPELSSAKSLIDSEINSDIVYYRNYKSMDFDPESFDIYSNGDGSYTAYIGGMITYETTEVSPDDLSTVEGEEISEIRGFHLSYLEDKDWFVNLWGYTERYIDTDNLIEITVD